MVTHCVAQEAKKILPVQRREIGQLPKVPTVESMLRPSPSIETVLSRTPTESAYEKDAIQTDNRDRTNQEDVAWSGSQAGWTAPQFYTRPLYFEQAHFERYASNTPEWTRPAISYAQFLGTIPTMPYKLVATRPRTRVYTPGHYPYDQVAPAHSNRNKQAK